jgi:3'-phosphoadenosine 5'-phosphosulfate sulfotransferase (PAPS reductase)/FAD synthetase
MRIIVSFSGGKDSQACLIWAAKKYGVDKIEAVFCDTGWEHPDTYWHIKTITEQMGVRLTIITNKDNQTFQTLAVKYKIFPTPRIRYCTVQLKIQPMIDWILQQKDHLIIIQGIRRNESESRAKMAEECSYFAGYYEKTSQGKYIRQYRRKDVVEWTKKYDASVLRPIFNWSSQDVIDYIVGNNQDVNILYKRGASRVGCFPCVMARKGEIKQLAKDAPMLNRLIQLEIDVNSQRNRGFGSFFPKGYLPKSYCKEFGAGVPSIRDVVDYVTRNTSGVEDMFEPKGGYSCMSIYHGLCE